MGNRELFMIRKKEKFSKLKQEVLYRLLFFSGKLSKFFEDVEGILIMSFVKFEFFKYFLMINFLGFLNQDIRVKCELKSFMIIGKSLGFQFGFLSFFF